MVQYNMPSPLDELLRSRGGQQGTSTSRLVPSPLPMDPFANVKAGTQLGNFYDRLNNIGKKTEEQQNAAEDAIYRQIQKKKEEALLKKIKAMMPQPIAPPSGGGGGGLSPPDYSPPPRRKGSSDLGGDLNLPKIYPGGGKGGNNSVFPPIVAPPPRNWTCTPWMRQMGLC